ncbi:MAG: hypothetical protein HC888_13705 [Candidatus Competibacteraceae bacterium]|nr:hypothetical protein [Candidatus Competibacteraceae bacterium]
MKLGSAGWCGGLCSLGVACLLLGTITAVAQPFGIETRVANTTLLIDQVPAATPGQLTLEPAFPELSFAEPLALAEVPDSSGAW